MKFIDLVGKTFNRLTVLEREFRNPARTHWKCQCSCGNITVVESGRLRTGGTKSCGCLSVEISSINGKKNFKHGMTGSAEYKIWWGMKDRCYNSEHPLFKNYGGRRILVWDAWMISFENFYKDMGPRPSPKHSLDRIDNDGPYAPGNCRWATPEEQANNRRDNDVHFFRGEFRTLSQIAKFTGIPQPTLWSRLNRMKLTIEDAVAWKSYKHVKK